MVVAHSPRPPPWPRNISSGVQTPPRVFHTHPPISSFGFCRLINAWLWDCSLCRAPRAPPNRNPVVPQKTGTAVLGAAESPASRQARLASDKAATRRRRQAQTLESSITAKRRNSEKKRERRAAESPASRQARRLLTRLQLGDAVRRWSPAPLRTLVCALSLPASSLGCSCCCS